MAPRDKKAVVRNFAPKWSLSRACKEFPISEAAAGKIKQTQGRLFGLQRQYLELENPNNERWDQLVARNDPAWRFAHEEQRRLAAGWSKERLQAWRDSANAWMNTAGGFPHVLAFDEIMQGLEREDWTFASAQAFISEKVEEIRASMQPRIDQLKADLCVQTMRCYIEAFYNAGLVMFARVDNQRADHTIVDMAALGKKNPILGTNLETIAQDGSDSLFDVYLAHQSDVKEMAAPGRSEAPRHQLVRSLLEQEELFDDPRGLTLKGITRELVIPFLTNAGYKIPKENKQLFESIYREVCRIFSESRSRLTK